MTEWFLQKIWEPHWRGEFEGNGGSEDGLLFSWTVDHEKSGLDGVAIRH